MSEKPSSEHSRCGAVNTQPHTMTRQQFRADPHAAFELTKSGPITIVDENGKPDCKVVINAVPGTDTEIHAAAQLRASMRIAADIRALIKVTK